MEVGQVGDGGLESGGRGGEGRAGRWEEGCLEGGIHRLRNWLRCEADPRASGLGLLVNGDAVPELEKPFRAGGAGLAGEGGHLALTMLSLG